MSDSSESQVKDHFSTFLKEASSHEWPNSPPEPPPPSGAEAPAEAPETVTIGSSSTPGGSISGTGAPIQNAKQADLRMGLVAYLAANGPAPIANVQSTFGIGFTEVGPLLAKLEAAGLIKVTGDPGVEIVELTPQGAELA